MKSVYLFGAGGGLFLMVDYPMRGSCAGGGGVGGESFS